MRVLLLSRLGKRGRDSGGLVFLGNLYEKMLQASGCEVVRRNTRRPITAEDVQGGDGRTTCRGR